jgi:hypothetical protein
VKIKGLAFIIFLQAFNAVPAIAIDFPMTPTQVVEAKSQAASFDQANLSSFDEWSIRGDRQTWIEFRPNILVSTPFFFDDVRDRARSSKVCHTELRHPDALRK